MTTTDDVKDVKVEDEDTHNFAGVCTAAVMARQHTRAALAHKQAIESPCTLPSERRDMEQLWQSHLCLARKFAKQLDQACDVYIASLELRDNK